MSYYTKLDANLNPTDGPHAAVLDTRTGLIWSVAYASDERLVHAEALTAAAAVTLGGCTDWRLPTVQELLSLVDYERVDPAIDTDAFPGTRSAWHWSSTPVAGAPGYAWDVHFGDGSSYWHDRSDDGFVRAVCGPVGVSK